MHQLTIQLPDELFYTLQKRAETTQTELHLLVQHSLRAGLPPSLDKVPERFHTDLLALNQLGVATLRQISQLDLPEDVAAEYGSLLEKQQTMGLDEAEQQRLVTWREEADLLMLRRAYASALLKWREQAGVIGD
jgi:hypothetical protein